MQILPWGANAGYWEAEVDRLVHEIHVASLGITCRTSTHNDGIIVSQGESVSIEFHGAVGMLCGELPRIAILIPTVAIGIW